MKRYMEYMRKHRESAPVVTQTNEKPTQDQKQDQLPGKEQEKVGIDLTKDLQKQLREKKSEVDKIKKLNEELMKKQEELLMFQKNAIKEKETIAIRTEISKVAKKFNVKDSAIEDVIGLVGPKLKVQGDVVFFENHREEDGKPITEAVEVESFFGNWIEGKDYFIQTQQARPSGITPVPSGPKPVVKKEQEVNKYGKQVFSTEDFFGPKK